MPVAQLPTVRTTDALSRRLRFSKPNPMARRLVLTEADYLIFEAIDRHGPLPTGYLFEFTKHLRRDFSHLQNRLTEFYNGDLAGGKAGPWLARPPRQFASFEARYQHIVYSLAPRAKMALAERGTLSRFGTRATGPFVHQLMSACVGVSLERAAAEAGIRYIPREEVFSHPNCRGAREVPNPLALPLGSGGQKTLVPDDIFGLGYPEGGFRFFALEIDRCTESIDGSKAAKGSWAAKVAGYRHILDRRLHRDWWGVPNLTVLTVTTNRVHAANLIDHLRRHVQHADRFAFAVESSFGANWRVPRQLFSHLLQAPWLTPTGKRCIATPQDQPRLTATAVRPQLLATGPVGAYAPIWPRPGRLQV